MKTLLKIDKISYKYPNGDKLVLEEASAEFSTGKLYCVVGPSGSGKTTFLSLIAGLDIATDGRIYILNEDMSRIDRDAYRAKDVGVIFQSYNLLMNATALDNMVLSMHISEVKNAGKEEAMAFLQKVGIDTATANRKVSHLSGGEQQRVSIARAILHNPNIIIADEPTGNLDKINQDAILDILLQLAHEENKCVIVVTHSQEVAAKADNVYALNDGKLVLQ